MLIPPRYELTPKISQLLQSIEAAKAIIDSYPLPPEIETNIRRKSILKSSLYSARIEGNNLTFDELLRVPSKDQRKVEIFNILKASEWIWSRGAKDLVLNDILKLHQIVMMGLVEKSDLGKFRVETSAIFNSGGIAIYLPPRPSQLSSLIQKLLTFINSSREQFIPARASLAHYTFEKIHPFLDGNGRVGRLLLQAVLTKGGYGMKGLLITEEYLDLHRGSYYLALENTERDVTEYLEFILQAISETAITTKEEVLAKKDSEIEDFLLPRRAEILNIIRDHRLINFDTVRRRFMSVNERTLRYDLKKLQEVGLIKKRGSTNGVYYELSK